MPYIDRSARYFWARHLDALVAGVKETGGFDTSPGAFNYIITRLLCAFLGETPNYDRFNAAIGVLECAKLELYRRMVVPYEETKRDAHGDVYHAA